MNPKKVQKGESIDQWLSRAPEALQPLLTKLRGIITAHPAGFAEQVKWAYPYYTLNCKEAFSIMWHSKHVGLELWNGVFLPNPSGLIVGTGKKARHIKIHGAESDEWAAVNQAIEDTITHLTDGS